jgi:hypothetical protein
MAGAVKVPALVRVNRVQFAVGVNELLAPICKTVYVPVILPLTEQVPAISTVAALGFENVIDDAPLPLLRLPLQDTSESLALLNRIGIPVAVRVPVTMRWRSNVMLVFAM